MRAIALIGVLLVAFGVVVLTHALRYPDSKTVIDAGDFHASLTEHPRVPDWVGIAAVTGGVLLIGAGSMSRRARG
jgi:hypothetical protein